MAISGILVHCLKDDLERVEKQVSSMEELTTYGIHEDAYVVAVVESPSDLIEKVVKNISSLNGVLTVYTTYLRFIRLKRTSFHEGPLFSA